MTEENIVLNLEALKESRLFFREKETEQILASMMNGIHTYIYGSTGTGKTTAVKRAIEKFNSNKHKAFYVSCTNCRKLRQYLKGLGFEPYLIGDEIEIRWGERIDSNRLKAFDAVTGYTLPPTGNYVDRSPSAVRAEYSRWQSAAHSVGVEIVPSVSPGFDDRYLVQTGYRTKSYGYVPRSIEYFKTNLQIAKEFVDKSKLLKISTWNEWEENTNIEPTVQEGYDYLRLLRDAVSS